jgi:MscS family membrane protein
MFLLSPTSLSARSSQKSRVADTSSPRATLFSFIEACNELQQVIKTDRKFDRSNPKHHWLGLRILDCLDYSQLPDFAREDRAAEVASCLKEIIDRTDLPPFEKIPDVEAIEEAYEKCGRHEKLDRWRIPGTRTIIARVTKGPQKHEYLFSAGTVERAVRHYRDVRGEPYRTSGPKTSPGLYHWYLTAPGHTFVKSIVDKLPEGGNRVVGGMALWKWIGLLIGLTITVGLMGLAYFCEYKLGTRYKRKHVFKYCLVIVFPIFATLIPIGLERFATDWLTMRGDPIYITSFACTTAALLAMIVVAFAICHRVAEVIIASPSINPDGLNV